MKISFVTCSNVAPASWIRLLDGIAAQVSEGGDFEVVAVNNGFSTARARELIDSDAVSKLGSRFRLINETRPGLAYARSTGMAAAVGEWLVLLDDDNTVESDFIISLRSELMAHPEVGGIVALITPVWETPVPTWLAKFGVYCLSYTSPTVGDEGFVDRLLSPRETVSFSSPPGGGMIIHSAVVRRYLASENLDERLTLGRVPGTFYGCEDFDLWSEIFAMNLGVLVSRRIRVAHHIPTRRTRFTFLCRLNYQMSYSWGLMRGLRGESANLGSIWSHVIMAKRHLVKALRGGSLPVESLWWVKAVGFDRGFRNGASQRHQGVEGKN